MWDIIIFLHSASWFRWRRTKPSEKKEDIYPDDEDERSFLSFTSIWRGNEPAKNPDKDFHEFGEGSECIHNSENRGEHAWTEMTAEIKFLCLFFFLCTALTNFSSCGGNTQLDQSKFGEVSQKCEACEWQIWQFGICQLTNMVFSGKF